MEPPRCGVCHETIEGIIACPKCMAPIHSGCADFKGDGPCGITYACDGSTGDGSKGENTLGRSDQADSKDAQFMMVHEAYERVKRYQLKPQSIFMWYRRWITSSISEKEGIEYIAWKLAQPSATYQEVNFSGGLMSRWVGQCHEFWSGEGRSDSGVNNELVSARLAKGLLRFDDRNDSRTSCLVSFYPSAYEQVVKDLITVGTYPAAMGIASESEILPLIKKASYCIGTAYQQMDDKKELALGYFIRGGHTNKIIELVVNNVTIRFEGLFSEGIKVRPYLDQVANYFRKNHDFQSLYILGKACDQRCLQDEAESALSRFQLATSLGDYKEEPKGLADHKIPRIDMQISKSQEK